MNKKVLTISLITLFLGVMVFGAAGTALAKQEEVSVQNRASIRTLVEPLVVREQLSVGYGPGANTCNGSGKCDGSMDQIHLRQRLQDGTDENCTTPGECTGQQLGQNGSMESDQQLGHGSQGAGMNGQITCPNGGDCTFDQIRLHQHLQDGSCLNNGNGTSTGN